MMEGATPEDLLDTCHRALAAFQDPKRWRAMQIAGMGKDFGWGPAAKEYAAIYRRIVRSTSSSPSRSGA
jgi:starch synthase